jgi:hypothetical protein
MTEYRHIWAIDIIHRFAFKPVECGFIYRAPKSGLFARAEQYLVTLEQRDAIVALLISDQPRARTSLVALGLAALVLATLHYAASIELSVLAVLLLLAISEHFLTSRKFLRLQPVLSKALKVVP